MMQTRTAIADRDRNDLRARWPLRAIAASLALHAVLAVLLVKLSGGRTARRAIPPPNRTGRSPRTMNPKPGQVWRP